MYTTLSTATWLISISRLPKTIGPRCHPLNSDAPKVSSVHGTLSGKISKFIKIFFTNYSRITNKIFFQPEQICCHPTSGKDSKRQQTAKTPITLDRCPNPELSRSPCQIQPPSQFWCRIWNLPSHPRRRTRIRLKFLSLCYKIPPFSLKKHISPINSNSRTQKLRFPQNFSKFPKIFLFFISSCPTSVPGPQISSQ